MTTPEKTGGRDIARQTAVALSAVVAVAGLVIGSGSFGSQETADAADGAFAATATLLAPAGPAFAIWSVIYLGLLALGVYQALPSQRSDPRLQQTGWWIALTMLANTAWILVVQAGGVWASVAVILVLLAALVAVYARLLQSPPVTRAQRILLDGTMGLYLGWVSVATAANIAAAGTASGWRLPAASLLAALVVMVVTVVAVLVGLIGGGRWPFSIAAAWGLAWLAVARLATAPQDTLVGTVAAVGALAVLATPLVARRSSSSDITADHQTGLQQPTA